MGLFGPAKIKVTPRDFVKSQLDEIFSPSSIEAEKSKRNINPVLLRNLLTV